MRIHGTHSLRAIPPPAPILPREVGNPAYFATPRRRFALPLLYAERARSSAGGMMGGAAPRAAVRASTRRDSRAVRGAGGGGRSRRGSRKRDARGRWRFRGQRARAARCLQRRAAGSPTRASNRLILLPTICPYSLSIQIKSSQPSISNGLHGISSGSMCRQFHRALRGRAERPTCP